jgi:uncharacterized protein with HEPN domain/predicted nucleotidyltransferase
MAKIAQQAPITKTDIFKILQEHREHIKALGVHRLGVFGSFVRGEQTEQSDVDILVQFAPGKKSFDNFIQLAFLLEELLHRRVELVTFESVSPYIRPYILREVEYVSFGFVEIPYVPADESAVLADGSVLKHALKPASAGFHLLSRMLQHPAPKDVYRASLSILEYLRHIRDEADYLVAQAQRVTKETFMQDKTLQRAFVRSLEIIGEAAKKVPSDFRQQYSSIDWKALAGVRDRLIHGYFGVDYEIVWDIVTTKVPVLHKEIQHILRLEGSE